MFSFILLNYLFYILVACFYALYLKKLKLKPTSVFDVQNNKSTKSIIYYLTVCYVQIDTYYTCTLIKNKYKTIKFLTKNCLNFTLLTNIRTTLINVLKTLVNSV